MSAQKRDSASPSSNQPNQPKRPRDSRINQERSCLTEEDVQRVFRTEVERAMSPLAEYCQSFIENAFQDVVQRMDSVENALRELKATVELEKMHCPHLGRANAESTAKNDTRNLQLQFLTKLSLPLFTGEKLKGEGGACIEVALIDPKTGGVVTSGLESSIKLNVVVLEGDFNKDNEDNWIHEDFENHVVKERQGKRPLLIGNPRVTLKEGFGQLGELTFTDNSSWIRSKSFRIGLQIASGYSGTTRIQEAITDAFAVKEHRGKSSKKSHPPKSDDEVWRLEKIAKDGKSHQKLSEAGIDRVEDFLLQLFTDPNKLREILGTSIILKNWDILVDHAKTCETDWKVYLHYSDGMKHGAVFKPDGQLIGLIKDGVSFATRRLSAQEKELGDTIVKRAVDNRNDIREFNGETFSVSMPKKSSSSFPSQVLGGQTDNLTPRIFASPVGLEAPPANAVSTAEGYNDSISTRYQMQPLCVNVNSPLQVDGSSFPLQNPLISSSHQTQLLSLGPSQASASGFHAAGPSSLPPCRGAEELFLEEEIRMRSHEMLENEDMQHLPRTFNMGGHNQSSFNATEDGYQFSSACMPNLSQNFGFKQNRSRSFGEADVGWLKIKAVMRWGFFVRKKAAERRAQLRELDETETRNEDEAELAFMFICSSPSLPDSCQF